MNRLFYFEEVMTVFGIVATSTRDKCQRRGVHLKKTIATSPGFLHGLMFKKV